MSKLLIISGSNNKNLELSNAISLALNEINCPNEIIDVVSLELPLYSNLNDGSIPSSIVNISKKFIKADKIVFVSPEYNGGITPALLNFITWLSRVSDDWSLCFSNKVAALASFSGSGGTLALSLLRLQLAYLGMNVQGQHLRASYQSAPSDQQIGSFVNSFSRFFKNF